MTGAHPLVLALVGYAVAALVGPLGLLASTRPRHIGALHVVAAVLLGLIWLPVLAASLVFFVAAAVSSWRTWRAARGHHTRLEQLARRPRHAASGRLVARGRHIPVRLEPDQDTAPRRIAPALVAHRYRMPDVRVP